MKFFSKDFYIALAKTARESPKKTLLVGSLCAASLALATGTATAIVANNNNSDTAVAAIEQEAPTAKEKAADETVEVADIVEEPAEETPTDTPEKPAAEEPTVNNNVANNSNTGNSGSSNSSGSSAGNSNSYAPPANSNPAPPVSQPAPQPNPQPAPPANNPAPQPVPPAPAPPVSIPPQQVVCGENMEPDGNGGCKAIVWTIGQMIAEVQSYTGAVPVNSACTQNALYATPLGFQGSPDHIAFMQNGPWRAMSVVQTGGGHFVVYLCR